MSYTTWERYQSIEVYSLWNWPWYHGAERSKLYYPHLATTQLITRRVNASSAKSDLDEHFWLGQDMFDLLIAGGSSESLLHASATWWAYDLLLRKLPLTFVSTIHICDLTYVVDAHVLSLLKNGARSYLRVMSRRSYPDSWSHQDQRLTWYHALLRSRLNFEYSSNKAF